MSQQKWKIHYQNKEGKSLDTNISWPGEPSREQAAVRIRERLIGKHFLLVDTPRRHPEPTIFLLQRYGFEITDIEEITE